MKKVKKGEVIKMSLVILVLITLVFLFSCAPISSETDAANFTNAMAKSFFAGDENKTKFIASGTITLGSGELNDFTASHFYSDITSSESFAYLSLTYNSSEVTFDGITYILDGTVYLAFFLSSITGGLEGDIVAYGNLSVTKDNNTQDITFDAKYSASFLYADDDDNDVYDFTFSGSVESHVNDFIVEDSSWSITFSSDFFNIFPG